ncbi:MAG: dTMP kinase [Burkholderiales bacterium]|nr:dTMP kinase [Burkholderiales bacterium]
MNGLFISFEGIDGAGKSTHIERLAQCFRDQGRAVTLTREPGGTPLAERLRQMVLNDPMDTMTEALLVFAARRDHIQNVIVPGLLRGDVVLCDRFTDATFAYQGQGRGFDSSVLKTLESWVQGLGLDLALPEGMLQPHVTVWFDLPAQVAAQRLAGARVPDKFEAQPHAFFEKVSQGYAMRCADEPARFVRVDASQTPEAVWQSVHQAAQAKGLLP